MAQPQAGIHAFPTRPLPRRAGFFIAYTRSLGIVEKMLERMIGISGDGEHDRLPDYTRAVSGATFFAPSLRILQTLGSSRRS